MSRFALHAGWLAGLVFFLALFGFGAAVAGFEHARHSIGVLGRAAPAFAWVGYALPGLLVAVFAARLAGALRDDTLAARLGAQCLLIAGLAFAAQAAFPIDPALPDGSASQRHVAALMGALIAALAAAALLGAGVRRHRRLRAEAWGCGALMLVLLVAPPDRVWPGLAGLSGLSQRLLLAAFFALPALASRALLRPQRL